MKLSAYHKAKGNSVQLLKLNIPYYTYRKRKFPYIPPEYDKIYCSVVFDGTLDLMQNKRTIFGGENIIFGGTGFSLNVTLPDNIENLKPDYSIYPDNDISYGFISRGCIRKCYFCKVPEKEGGILTQADVVALGEFARAEDVGATPIPQLKSKSKRS
ncbi:hypothetical protein LCGC14_3160870 [marine sediment metagenome]|uniref:Uncharacterized protein n=1 Tax=marine sediment metagenome TaxID=412755 RepID=A0A0F8XY29_9ZZZZ